MLKKPTSSSRLYFLVAVMLALSVAVLTTGAQKTPEPAAAEPAAPQAEPAKEPVDVAAVAPTTPPTADEVAAYLETYGWMVGQQAGFEMGFSPEEKAALMKGIERAASGEKAPENMREIFPKMQEYLSEKEKAYRAGLLAKMEEEAKVHLAEGEKFLAEVAKKEGIQKTESGMYYQIETPGTGSQPSAQDVVTLHYTGKLVDGTVFDSSIERGTPVDLPLYGVIPGFSEGLQLLKEGGKATFYIPAALGYGNQSAGPIPPGSTLIFYVELIKVQPKPAEPAEAMSAGDEAEDEEAAAMPVAEEAPAAEVKAVTK